MRKLFRLVPIAIALAFAAPTFAGVVQEKGADKIQKAPPPVVKEKAADSIRKATKAREQFGLVARVEYTRPCQPGMVDVSVYATDLAGLDVNPFADVTTCGLLGYETRHNALTNEGANDVWATYFAASGRSAGGTWYVGLTSATPTATSTLATITEISGNGYSRQAITWNFGTSRQAQTGNVVFTATGAWPSGATHLIITNVASGTSGKLFNYLALSATRQPAASGDTITVSWTGTL